MPKEERKKLDAKAIKCIFVGYDEKTKAYRCFDPVMNKIHINKDVIFDETHRYEDEDHASGESIKRLPTILEEEDEEDAPRDDAREDES